MFQEYKLYCNVCIVMYGAQNVLFHTITGAEETYKLTQSQPTELTTI